MKRINDWNWIELESVASTNDEAMKYDRRVIITALEQTNGRGRRGRSWIGLEGNLFLTINLNFEAHYLSRAIIGIGLALLKTIKKLDNRLNVKLKWPNDVLVNGKKVSGILVEKGRSLFWAVGIGINIKEAPDEQDLIYPATSLALEGVEIDRLDFLQKFMDEFDAIENENFERIREEWLDNVKDLGSDICLKDENVKLCGVFTGIDNDGLMLMKTENGIKKVMAGDVYYIQGTDGHK